MFTVSDEIPCGIPQGSIFGSLSLNVSLNAEKTKVIVLVKKTTRPPKTVKAAATLQNHSLTIMAAVHPHTMAVVSASAFGDVIGVV